MLLSRFTLKSGTYLIQGSNGSGKTLFLEKLFHTLSFNNKIYINQLPLDLYPEKNFLYVLKILKKEHVFHSSSFLQHIQYLHLNKILSQKFENLSGGEKQLLKILLFLSFKSQFFFIDEPLNFLDYFHKEYVLKILQHLNETKTLFIVEHQNYFHNFNINKTFHMMFL
jgi:ABC-type cobalamin/Fe3+-siderophores transport system ATPase subunit